VAANPHRLGKPFDARFEEVLSTQTTAALPRRNAATLRHGCLATAIRSDALPAA
jgi:hypothetical protein